MTSSPDADRPGERWTGRGGAGPRSRGLNEVARRLFPGGVSSPVRAFRSVGGEPPVIRAARGAYLADVDGNRYVDLIGAWGPMVLGHSHPAVVAAVVRRMRRGSATGTPSPDEPRLARRIRDALPSVERLRFVCSGTEATMSALRLARAATGREGIVKFEGCYHGHGDAFLSAAGSGALTFDAPDSPGVPASVVGATHTVPYNDLAAVERVLRAHAGAIAAVFVEPVVGNMGFVEPLEGFLVGLRRLCDAHGALLVFDEVMTGFRVHRTCAQGLYGVRPDLTTLGKVIGGGYPVGAYGGRADLLAKISPEGKVYQAGTLAGHPVAMTAGLATLRGILRPGAFEAMADATGRIATGIERALCSAGVEAVAPHLGGMMGLWFAPRAPRNLAEAKATRTDRFRAFHAAMLAGGVYLPPSPYEAWFVSAAHGPREVERVVEAAALAAAVLPA
ncbi:MAG TPA: glutamate-1-semialdehyde 2,1-aminomutase [Planctomycetota bacterium]|nr:glutamate-1-semialdehyde 2,1-aminomutase [Planctomycetota bacterium]